MVEKLLVPVTTMDLKFELLREISIEKGTRFSCKICLREWIWHMISFIWFGFGINLPLLGFLMLYPVNTLFGAPWLFGPSNLQLIEG